MRLNVLHQQDTVGVHLEVAVAQFHLDCKVALCVSSTLHIRSVLVEESILPLKVESVVTPNNWNKD